MPRFTPSLRPASNGSSMPSPTDTPSASSAPRLPASMMPGPPPVMTVAPASTMRRAMSTANAYSGVSSRRRADPKIEIAGPSSASVPNPSTNSDWMRRTRHGSLCAQSAFASRLSSR